MSDWLDLVKGLEKQLGVVISGDTLDWFDNALEGHVDTAIADERRKWGTSVSHANKAKVAALNQLSDAKEQIEYMKAQGAFTQALTHEQIRDDKHILVDFDGTLADYHQYTGWQSTGDAIPKMLERVKAWIKKGHKVKIFTARMHDARSKDVIQDWCERNGLPRLEVTNVKSPAAVVIWDDIAVSVAFNTGERVVNVLHQEIDELIDERKGLLEQIKNLESINKNLKSLVDEKEGECQNLLTNYNRGNMDLAHVRKQRNDAWAQTALLEGQVDKLSKQVTEVIDERNRAWAMNDSVEADKKILNTRIAHLEGALAATNKSLSNTIFELGHEKELRAAYARRLAGFDDDAEATNATLKRAGEVLNEYDRCKQDKELLRSAIQTRDAAIEELNQEIAELMAQPQVIDDIKKLLGV